MNNFDAQFEVYKNLFRFLEYRGVKTSNEIKNQDELTRHIRTHEYIMINGERSPDDERGGVSLQVYLLGKDTDLSTETKDFKKFLATIASNNVSKENKKQKKQSSENIVSKENKKQKKQSSENNLPREIILVIEKINKTIYKRINNFYTQYSADFIAVNAYHYFLFIMEIPKHISVPPHFIAKKEEIQEFCAQHYCEPIDFPKILSTDPQVIWLGAHPGMCIKIIRPSETSGINIIYRYVI